MNCNKLLVKTNFLRNVLTTSRCQAHTLIFERVYEPYLPKVGEKAKLKRRHNILKVKRFENGPKELKVVLTESSKLYGVKGEVVELPKMFARQLLAQKEAIYASPENIEEFALDPESDEQTLTGRRTAFWLSSHEVFNCQFPSDTSWTLNAENLSRCLQRDYDVLIPPSAIELPEYEINNENAFDENIHDANVTVNGVEKVTIQLKFEQKS